MSVKPAFYVGHDVHHVTVAFDKELVGNADCADRRDATDIVPPEIKQHEMFGALFRIGQKFDLQRLVVVRRRATRPGAGNRADRHSVVAQPHQHFGTGARDSKLPKSGSTKRELD